MDHGKFVLFIRMGMGVYVTGFPMGSPAGMANAQGTHGFFAYDFLTQGVQTAHAFFYGNFSVIVYCDAGRVIASVFQFAQALHQKWGCLFSADISYDSAHSCALLNLYLPSAAGPSVFLCYQRGL